MCNTVRHKKLAGFAMLFVMTLKLPSTRIPLALPVRVLPVMELLPELERAIPLL